MTDDHPNIALLKQLDPSNMTASTDLFAEDAVFHYFNPNLPDLQATMWALTVSVPSSNPSPRCPGERSRSSRSR